MPNAWNGADPAQVGDAGDYELGSRIRANVDITISAIRVHTGPGELNFPNRKGRFWTTGGGSLAVVDMPDDPATGWTTHVLGTPLEVAANTTFIASYSTAGNYSALTEAFANAVTSNDGAVTFLSGPATGNGIFNTDPGVFPSNASGNQSFYGVDIVYTLGFGANTPPVITSLTVGVAGAIATATITATDAESLVGASVRYDWGDGTLDTVTGDFTAQHTYLASGDYPVTVILTDAAGAYDFKSGIARVRLVGPTTEEMTLQRDLTQWFIDADPSDVILIPQSRVRTSSGGSQYVDQAARAVQKMRMIRMSHTQKPVITEDGKERQIDFTLLGTWDSVMAVNDYWRDAEGLKYEIVELVPYNGYERKGLVVKHGHG